jgi:hypothetical protein
VQGLSHATTPTQRGSAVHGNAPRFWLLTQRAAATGFAGGIAVAVGDVDH